MENGVEASEYAFGDETSDRPEQLNDFVQFMRKIKSKTWNPFEELRTIQVEPLSTGRGSTVLTAEACHFHRIFDAAAAISRKSFEATGLDSGSD